MKQSLMNKSVVRQEQKIKALEWLIFILLILILALVR